MVSHTIACEAGKEPYKTALKVLHMLSLDEVVSIDDKVVIKPNLCINKGAYTGLTTHPEVVEAIIDWVKSKTNEISIVESNVSALNLTPEVNFKDCGYSDLSNRKGVKLVNLSKDAQSTINLDKGLAQNKWEISKELLEANVIINVPVIKTNNLTAVTLGVKNLYGLWGGNKWSFHNDIWDAIDRKTLQINRMIENAILDLFTIFKSKLKLTVLDGIVGSDGYFGVTIEHPRNANFICAGYDLFSVDRVGAELIGVNPTKLAYLRSAEKAGLGSFNDKLNIIGAKISDIKCEFDLGIDEALKVMDALFNGHRNFADILKATDLDEQKLRYLLNGLEAFGHISIIDNNIKIKSRIFMNYIIGKTILVD